MDSGEVHEPAYTVVRFGGTFSITRAVRCGFRSRRRVQGARAFARAVWGWREMLWAGWDSHWEQVSLEDRQRACPHPTSRCYRPDTWTATDGAICELCSASVPWTVGIPVLSVEERIAAQDAQRDLFGSAR